MRTIEQLRKRHLGETIYIVGSGPSIRLFPLDFLAGKITIGLNQTYKFFPATYSLTIHPYLIPLNRDEWNTIWCTKIKYTDPKFRQHRNAGNYKKFYLFDNNNEHLNFKYITERHVIKERYKFAPLYVGRGIHTGAMHLAALMGAKNIILIGCDLSSIGTDHHAHEQHIETHGYSEDEVYDEYFYYALKVQEILRKNFKVNILSLTPFFGLKNYNKQYKYQCDKLGLPKLNKPEVIEIAKRHEDIVRDFL